MTFDDDYIQIELPGYSGTLRQFCAQRGMDWPPPETLRIGGGRSTSVYRRESFSQITDAERLEMTNVCRGALYVFDHDEEPSNGRRQAD